MWMLRSRRLASDRRGLKKNLVLGIAAASLLAGLYLTPYLALHQMRAAARAQDLPTLTAMVDFPALRDSLKLGLRAQLVGGEASPASVMGAEVAGALLGPMVDTLITPDSLARLLQGQPPTQVGLASAPASPQLQTQMGYESPGRFVFSIKPADSDDDPVALVLRRDGL